MSEFKDKIVLITGGTGSIGSELVRQILKQNPKRLRIFSRDESKQYELMEELGYPGNVQTFIGDVRDQDRLEFAFRDVDIVLHAAAMKHVSISEYNPFEVVKTNIVGSQNVINAAIKQKVKKVIGISTDKAVNPTGILGTSKLMMEKLFVNATNYTKHSEIVFACVRFGNVLWSRGSVLPSWKSSVEREGVIKITDKEMTRFFMTQEHAIGLVLKATELTQGGEIFILKMPAIGLADLAKAFIEKYYPKQTIVIEEIGKRSGEKMHEELLDGADLGKYIFTNYDMIIAVDKVRFKRFEVPMPSYNGFELTEGFQNMYSSDSMDKEKIKDLI